MNRREFLQSAAALAAARHALESYAAPPGTGTGIALRRLGKTGEKISMIGLGGYDLGMVREEKESLQMMDHAIDVGATFFDNAWNYHDGLSEERMGKALAAPSKRQKVFLMTKVKARDAAGAQKQLEDSLRRLRTDVIDLWQFHNLETFQDVATIFGPGGAMEVAQKARKEGKFRYLGFTGHTDPAVHLDMLDRYDWDAVMMSLNVVDAHWHSFQNQVLPKVLEKNMGVLAFKTLSKGRALIRAHTVREGLHYVWSLPVSVLISGMNRVDMLEKNLELAMKFQPMRQPRSTHCWPALSHSPAPTSSGTRRWSRKRSPRPRLTRPSLPARQPTEGKSGPGLEQGEGRIVRCIRRFSFAFDGESRGPVLAYCPTL